MKKVRRFLVAFSLSISLVAVNFINVNAANVVTMRIFSVYNTNKMHSWLMFTNNSSSSLTVGRYSLSPGEVVTVGTWGNLQYDGVWYNVEAYKQLTDHVSTSISITGTQLSTISSTIKNNNTWSALNNCSTFTVKVWNSVASTKLSAGTPNLPTQLANSIRNNTSFSTNLSMPKKSSTQTYATVKAASDYIIQVKPNGSGSSSFSNIDIMNINEKYQLKLLIQ